MPLSVVVLALSFLGQSQSSKPACFVEVGIKTNYGSADQLRDLQRKLKSNACNVFGLAWQFKPIPGLQRLLVWDATKQVLFRLEVQGSGPSAPVRWEKWTGATRDRILADNPVNAGGLFLFVSARGNTAALKPVDMSTGGPRDAGAA